MTTGLPPDMVITAYDKVRNTGAQVGVGWTQDDGSISLVLNPGTALVYAANVSYKVKPKVATEAAAAPTRTEPFKPARAAWIPPRRPNRDVTKTGPTFDDFDDDIPF